jgi:S-DNA-T family DNA segregation ATPase FtsK/SpoIIIE
MKPITIVLSPTRSRAVNVFLGLVLLLVSVLLFLALGTYHASDPSLNTAAAVVGQRAAENWTGIFGAFLSDLLLQAVGVAAFFIPLWLARIGWTWMRSRPSGPALLSWTGILLTLVFVPTVIGLVPRHWLWQHQVAAEGVVGRLMAGLLVAYLNVQGSWILAAVLAFAGIYFALAISFRSIWETIEYRWLGMVSLHDRWRNWREERAELREERAVERRMAARGDEEDFHPLRGAGLETREAKRGWFAGWFGGKRAVEVDPIEEIPAFRRVPLESGDGEEVPIVSRRVARPEWAYAAPAAEAVAAVAAVPVAAQAQTQTQTQTVDQSPAARVEDWLLGREPVEVPRATAPAPEPVRASVPARPRVGIEIHERADAEVRTATVGAKNVSGFRLPPSTLLTEGEAPQAVREEALREEARVLVEKCAEFGVLGQVVQINPGPMVTTYEFKPEAGVKYSRVTGLGDDLCLAMRAESILIERMPGKNTVGIQVPNHERETIHLRDVIESDTFAKAKPRLTLAMGKDINGRIVTADLNTMPHVLIAGSTGSGKSVAINAMIMSLLYRTTPSQVRLILVDPKRVELGMYEGIPHLFTPIITEPKLAANALRNAVREMERRLRLLASRSVRNIDQYNKLFEGSTPSLFGQEPGQDEEAPLPYIVIIIDELADLMMLDRANVEESITRLAQMARAVGIHLILATQRPSVDVITGLIKANVPTRISFRLATKVDSRTILDTNGAEALLGRGDMLFLPPGTSRLMRLHAPFVSEKETAAVVGFWKDQGAAEYVQGFLESPKDEPSTMDGSGASEEEDPMMDDAVRLVFEFGKASTSLLQRRLRIGYGRAAHLIDLMEQDGLVGPADGSRPRELLKAPGWLHEVPAVNS